MQVWPRMARASDLDLQNMRIALLSILLLVLPTGAGGQDATADVREWMRLGRVDRRTAVQEVRETRTALLVAARSRAASTEPPGALRLVMFRRLEAAHGVTTWNDQRRWFEDRLRVRLDPEALATTLGIQRGTTSAPALERCVGASIELGLGWTVAHCERALAYASGVPVVAHAATPDDLATELVRRGVPGERVRAIERALRGAMRALPHRRDSNPSAHTVALALLRSCPAGLSAVERVRSWEDASPTALACAASMIAGSGPRDGAVLATSDVFGLDISDAEMVLDHFAAPEALVTRTPERGPAERATTPAPARRRQSIARAVQQAHARLHACNDAAPYAGDVLFDATLSIDANGAVERVELVASAGEPNDAMTECVARVLRTVRFSDGPSESITVPLLVPRSE